MRGHGNIWRISRLKIHFLSKIEKSKRLENLSQENKIPEQKYKLICISQLFFVPLHAICVQGKTQSLNNTNMADILQTIERYRALGIDQQIDYKKFYLYSIITHSTALSIESENENCLVGPYEEVPNQRLKPI